MFWKSKEERFWKWFQTNEARLFDFEQDQYRIFEELNSEMKKVDAHITFEFGPKHDGKREFVISADGIKSSFPAVIALAEKAPELPRWKIIRFRPRREPMVDIDYEGTRVKKDDIAFTIEPDGDKAGITLFIKGYDQGLHPAYGSIGFLYLDNCLGEYDVETRVGFIEFKPATEATKLAKLPIAELPQTFDKFFAARLN